MRSSTGEHYPALDHIRGFAAFMVFTWHFLHESPEGPVPYGFVPALPIFSLLDEGHTGVSLFMALSGYLFAKLLDGKQIRYLPFFANRALRLLPLLLAVICIEACRRYMAGQHMDEYFTRVGMGFIFPTLPNGGWSITIEAHFYLLLPFLLMASRRFLFAPLLFIAAAIVLRSVLYVQIGEVQSAAPLTIIGHGDQFLAGILAFHVRAYAKDRHWLALFVLVAFSGFFWWFDAAGGFYQLERYPSPHWIWIILPTLEAAAYSFAIAYYDTSFSKNRTGLPFKVMEKAGSYSYSIYLLHLFFVMQLAEFINTNIMSLSNLYVACLWSGLCFLAMIPIGYLSYTCIEAPFLRLRVRYVGHKPTTADPSAVSVRAAAVPKWPLLSRFVP
ncbi:acyltransferase [Mesorhizobium sp.]|uniref:acyltransferase family protein n=1 Tax=Mesorhizobium sp. TaxID=1871066 RepID=UPI000FE95C14|nr:acyltransferase [Mesorhizobium sp.]RWK41449.1 MAG: acyltransferase [Mesorhizobium sp.]RWK68385.1 MAG: acyltransferase [Mesorhizobium sp.]RWK72478.1 MAG: acyltransferase [Mesorhizobium sp.]RWK84163.1 MAG: acyltransferase [Mesorhizobium sp.]RWL05852.1 MAG: acyltransferase [Mesorhizobium sp.]